MEFEPNEDDALSHDGYMHENNDGDEDLMEVEANHSPAPTPLQPDQLMLMAPADAAEDPDLNTPQCSQNSDPPSVPSSQQPPAAAAPPAAVQAQGRRSIAAVRMPGSVTDARKFPLRIRQFHHRAELLVVKREQLKSIESQSKSFSMHEAEDFPKQAGITWSFVDYCSAPGLSKELLQAIRLFATLNGMANNHVWNGYVVPTETIECTNDTKLKPRFAPNKKGIVGVVVELTVDRDEDDSQHDSPDESESFLADDWKELASGKILTAVPFLTMNIGFTAASFQTEGSDKEQIALFGVLSVTSLLNVDSLGMILDRFLAYPAMNSRGTGHAFKESDAWIRGLRESLEHVIIYQATEACGDRSGERPSQYFCNPGGRLGIDNVCHPGYETHKIRTLLQKHFKNPRDIRIIGYPNMDWSLKSDEDGEAEARRNHAEYLKALRAHQMNARSVLQSACEEYAQEKKVCKKRAAGTGRQAAGGGGDGGGPAAPPPPAAPAQPAAPQGGGGEQQEEQAKEFKVHSFFGWPVRRSADWYVDFKSSMCPVNMQFRQLRDIDVTADLDSFCMNMGALPPLTLSLLRSCLLYDGNNYTNLVLLRELDVPWNLAMIRKRYYSKDCRLQDHIATPGCQLGNYREIMRHIRDSVQMGGMSARDAVQMVHKVVQYGLNVFMGMAESNAFLSERVSEAVQIMQAIAREEGAGRSNMHNKFKAYQRHLLRMDRQRQPFQHLYYSPYDLARRTLLECVIDINTYKKLNSQNLQLKLEMMISRIGHSTGLHNQTHVPFGRGIEVVPACGTLSMIVNGSKDPLKVRHVAKPNSSGVDHTAKITSETIEDFCNEYGVTNSKQQFCNVQRFTKGSVEGLNMIQIDSKGNIMSLPDQKVNGMYVTLTEERGNIEQQQGVLIQHVYCRGEHQEAISLTTCEGAHKERVNITKVLVSWPNLCARCSNEDLVGKISNEQNNTIAAVTMMLDPGSSPHTEEVKEGSFTSVECSSYETRKVPLEGITASSGPSMLAGTNLTVSTLLGAPNMIGTVGNEICRVTLGVLDFLHFFSQKHLEPMFHPKCRGNNLLRLQKAYESRATYFTAWCRMLQYQMQCSSREEAVVRAVNSLQFDALALTDCPGLVWSLMRRCLHWGPVLYACCFIRECGMPVVPTKVLIRLLRMDAPPPAPARAGARGGAAAAAADPSEDRKWYDKIRLWLVDCVAQHRFCPKDAGGMEFSEYISSSGTDDGCVDANGILRVSSSVNGWKDRNDKMAVQNQLAAVLQELHGPELVHSCAMTQSAMACAVDDMINEFKVDIQRLLEVNLFDMERHFAFFGVKDRLQFQFRERNGKHPFTVRAVWQKDSRDVQSVGAGVHIMQLLVLGSLCGDFLLEKLHPKIINDLSLNLLTQLLRNAPKGILPGNVLEIRSFNCYNCALESVVLEEDHMQTESFLRCHDMNFAESGMQARCSNIEHFAIEDVLHMGAHCEVAARIGCKVVELPASEVTYFIRPRTTYCLFHTTTFCLGTLYHNGQELIRMEYQSCVDQEAEQMQAKTLDLFRWQEQLREMGFTMLPMIWRSGACVAYDGRVGCLVPPPANDPSYGDTEGNFSLGRLGYVARLGREETADIPVRETLATLLPIGQKLFLKLNAASAASISQRLAERVSQEALATSVLRVNLDSPNTLHPVPGKVYVACLVKQLSGNSSEQVVDSYCETIVADPWELIYATDGAPAPDLRTFEWVLQ